MEEKNKRNKYLKIRVSEAEMEAIKKKFQNSRMPTLSDFVRAMIFEGYIVQLDNNELKTIEKTANNIANNINQIAIRANSSGNVYPEDIAEIENLAHQIIQPLLFLWTQIMRVKRKLDELSGK